jgi:hypothetical protein
MLQMAIHVAYVANGYTRMLQSSVSNVLSIFKRVFQVFLFGCCICFIHMLQVFLSGCCICFTMTFQVFLGVFQVFQTHVLNVSSVFRRMMQMYLSGFSKVDRTLYILQCDSPSIAACCSCYDVVHARRAWRGCGRGKRGEPRGWSPPGVGVRQLQASGRGCSSGCQGASTSLRKMLIVQKQTVLKVKWSKKLVL